MEIIMCTPGKHFQVKNGIEIWGNENVFFFSFFEAILFISMIFILRDRFCVFVVFIFPGTPRSCTINVFQIKTLLWDRSYTTHKYSHFLSAFLREDEISWFWSSMKNCQQQRWRHFGHIFLLWKPRVLCVAWIACNLKCLTSLNCPINEHHQIGLRWPCWL